MRPMTIEDFLKYVNAEAHYASGIFCFCEYSVDFITDRDSEDGSFHVHVTLESSLPSNSGRRSTQVRRDRRSS